LPWAAPFGAIALSFSFKFRILVDNLFSFVFMSTAFLAVLVKECLKYEYASPVPASQLTNGGLQGMHYPEIPKPNLLLYFAES
jgi:hypothetical protein